MPSDAAEPLLGEHGSSHWQMRKVFSIPLVAVTMVLLAAFFALVRYPALGATDDHVNQYYMFFIHILIMIFVGTCLPLDFEKLGSKMTCCLVVYQLSCWCTARRFWLSDDFFEVRGAGRQCTTSFRPSCLLIHNIPGL